MIRVDHSLSLSLPLLLLSLSLTRQALGAISEVGDLLQLKYSRREEELLPPSSLGWRTEEESVLRD